MRVINDKKKVGIFLTLTLSFILYMSIASALISVSPPGIEGNAGDIKTVEIRVDGVTDLYAWQFRLDYDSNILNVSDAYYPADDEEYVFYGKEAIDQYLDPEDIPLYLGNGYVMYSNALFGGDEDTFTGDGILATIEFEVLQTTGATQLNIDFGETFLLDSNMNSILGCPHDVNKDGKIRVDDVLAVALCFGDDSDGGWQDEECSDCDINLDGKVRVDDILAVATAFGGYCCDGKITDSPCG